MLKVIGGRKILMAYIIMVIICAVYTYMIHKSQVLPGDWSTFVTALVTLGIGYGSVNGLSKFADKSKAPD